MCCLDPTNTFSAPDSCRKYMRKLVATVVQNNHLRSVAVGDAVVQQFDHFLDVHAKDVSFESFNSGESRVDTFLHGHMKGYPELWSMVRKLLILSHGEATVERGFSVNKEVEIFNMQPDTVVAHRLVCDYVSSCGGVNSVPITKELLNFAAAARSNYRHHLEEEKKKKLTEQQGQKRKKVEEELETARKKRRTLEALCDTLCEEADQLSLEAEGKRRSEMEQLISKSNALRSKAKQKKADLKCVMELIEEKNKELKQM